MDPATDLYMVPLDDPLDTAPPQGGDIHTPKAMSTQEVGSNKGKSNNTKNIAETINMHHLALGSPTKATFLQAIEKGWLTGLPSLSVENSKNSTPRKPKPYWATRNSSGRTFNPPEHQLPRIPHPAQIATGLGSVLDLIKT